MRWAAGGYSAQVGCVAVRKVHGCAVGTDLNCQEALATARLLPGHRLFAAYQVEVAARQSGGAAGGEEGEGDDCWVELEVVYEARIEDARLAALLEDQGGDGSTGSMVVRVELERAKIGGVKWSLVLPGEGAVGEPMDATLVLAGEGAVGEPMDATLVVQGPAGHASWALVKSGAMVYELPPVAAWAAAGRSCGTLALCDIETQACGGWRFERALSLLPLAPGLLAPPPVCLHGVPPQLLAAPRTASAVRVLSRGAFRAGCTPLS
ncbi:hypothetical protein T484DRAFT_1908094 [Baffinella frigidus]|nr:hypothetical protein T484DRAFT_1908094 [Cryptophyta sp. CCMP2293]